MWWIVFRLFFSPSDSHENCLSSFLVFFLRLCFDIILVQHLFSLARSSLRTFCCSFSRRCVSVQGQSIEHSFTFVSLSSLIFRLIYLEFCNWQRVQETNIAHEIFKQCFVSRIMISLEYVCSHPLWFGWASRRPKIFAFFYLYFSWSLFRHDIWWLSLVWRNSVTNENFLFWYVLW